MLVIALLLANLILIVVSVWGQDAVVPVSKTMSSGLRVANGSDVNLDNITLDNGTSGFTGSAPALLHSMESHDCNFTTTMATTMNEFIADDDVSYCSGNNMLVDRADGIGLTSR